MAITTVTVCITDEISPTFPSSASERACNLDFCYWKSTQRLTSVAYDRRTNRKFGIGVKMKATVNPYSYTEVARPEERKSLTDFLVEAGDFVRSDGGDGGPPRWFSPLECGARAAESPLLLYLPGIDGTGLGLIRQHKRLGEIFDIWCLHFPVKDRAPAQDLVKLIEKTVRSEHYRFPNRPIYIVGESIGASFALDVAASNPDIDLVLILANPVTRFNNFMLQPLLGLLENLPDGVPSLIAENFGFNQGSPLTEMFENMLNETDAAQMGRWLLGEFFASSSNLPTLIRIFPKDTLLWKLQLLKSASASANSQMDTVNAQKLILLSGRVVGEDDLCEIVLDYNDQMKIPVLKNFIEEITQDAVNLRNDEQGELGKQDLHVPGIIPKIPGRFYIYFGKPIETGGREKELNDKERAHEVYLQVKSEVERCMAYLKIKRETDPYRNILP